jgi:hypothetical protein
MVENSTAQVLTKQLRKSPEPVRWLHAAQRPNGNCEQRYEALRADQRHLGLRRIFAKQIRRHNDENYDHKECNRAEQIWIARGLTI